jgi:hypothetical protein
MVSCQGDQWAWEAGEREDGEWCLRCRDWVMVDGEVDEDGRWTEWCLVCGSQEFRDARRAGEEVVGE